VAYVEELEDCTGQALTLDETAGLKQIYRRRPIAKLQILADYYRGSRNG
jgi:hypothetical protein